MEHEIPEWLVEERKRATKELSNTIAKVITNSIFYTFLALLTGCILIAGYSGYLTLKERSVIKYQREEAPEPEHVLVSATITAYSSSPDETDDTPFLTASGNLVKHGTLACPSKYSFGTIILIEGKKYTCEDRMNKRFRNIERFDIWVESKQDAYKWGKRELTIKVYTNSYDTAM